MLDMDHLKSIWDYLEKPKDFIIITSLETGSSGEWVYFRPYCNPSFLRRPLNILDLDRLDLMAASIRLAIVFDPAHPENEAVQQIVESQNLEPEYIRFENDGLSCGSTQLKSHDLIRDHLETASLLVRGHQDVWLRNERLPMELEVEVKGREVNQVFSVSCDSPQLPREEWFRIDKCGRFKIAVDITPGVERDVWRVDMLDWTEGVAVKRVNPPEGRIGDAGLSRLIVVFDRTCPDNDHWLNARRLVIDGSAETSQSYETPGPPQSEEAIHFSEYNRYIRDALASSLAKLFGRETIIEVVAFADSIGDGVSDPEDFNLPAQSAHVTKAGGRTADRAAELFAPAGYSPGLDVWDPLEEALKAAVDLLAGALDGGAGIVIVGNSPPNPPIDVNSPLHGLTKVFGYPTTYRRRSLDWVEQLDRCACADIPVVYLFLEHSPPPGEKPEVFAPYQDLQDKVRVALGRCLTLTADMATPEGVESGLGRAVDELKRKKSTASMVRVLRSAL